MDIQEYYRHVTLLTAQLAPTFGKCGCVIVDDESKSIASTGYNFVKPGIPVMDDGSHICHAEESAINSCHFTRNGKYTLYVSLSPCMGCAKRIIDEPHIVKVCYGDVHPDPKYNCFDALIYMEKNGVKVQQF